MPDPKSNDVEGILSALGSVTARFTPGALETFLASLLRWNPQLGLISKRDPTAVAARLVGQSVALWEFVASEGVFAQAPKPWRVADVGTGGGFPGVVWKLLEPRIELSLIERKDRKAHFLQQVVDSMGLTEVRVVPEDVRELCLQEGYRESYDLVAMMAVAPPGELGQPLEELLCPDGFMANVRPSSQQLLEQRAGSSLVLVQKQESDFGTFVLYRKTQ
jgi:16S rRNA (guanine527-N7)-methyltransferase